MLRARLSACKTQTRAASDLLNRPNSSCLSHDLLHKLRRRLVAAVANDLEERERRQSRLGGLLRVDRRRVAFDVEVDWVFSVLPVVQLDEGLGFLQGGVHDKQE